jgi:hypothetical protein
MIVLDHKQGTPEWIQSRIGIPTASRFDELITPKTHKPSASATRYRNEILAEWILGHPIEWGSSQWMERGTSLEKEARAWYEFERDVEVRETGLILRDDRKVGGSPDGLVGDVGGVEIKCPAAHTHIGYLLGDGPDHTGQVQGLLYLTDRQWWDVVSYCPGFPASVVRVERDEDYIAALDEVLASFIEDLDAAKEKLHPHRVEYGENGVPDWRAPAVTNTGEGIYR